MEPIAQAGIPGAETSGDQNSPQVPEGVQKRIDELTREKHEAIREAEKHKAAAEAALAAIAAQGQSKVEAPPQVEIDPELRKQFDAYFGGYQRQMQQTVAELQKVSALSQARAGVAKAGLPEAVALEVEGVTEFYAKQGYVIQPDVALDIASGRVYRKQLADQAKNDAARRQSNTAPQGIQVQSAGIGLSVQPQNRPDLSRMSPEQRIAWYESAGIGNMPI
jgi:hypothetical protein